MRASIMLWCPTSLQQPCLKLRCHAGTIKDHTGDEEDVAVKVLSLLNAPPNAEVNARRELDLMCTVARQLGGSVVELKGYQESPEELVLAMELADCSLRDWLRGAEKGYLPAATWVRGSVLPVCVFAGLKLGTLAHCAIRCAARRCMDDDHTL